MIASFVNDQVELLSLYEDQEKTFCTPTGHHFPGGIISIDVSDRKRVGLSSKKSVVTAKYEIEYDFENFVDKKYPHREIKPEPTWSRVTFLLICSCGKQTKAETQNNIDRPWKAVCKCGKDLYYEENQIPLFQNTTRI